MKSQDDNNMTIITGKGLNITGVKAKKSLKNTELEDNLETHGDESFSI